MIQFSICENFFQRRTFNKYLQKFLALCIITVLFWEIYPETKVCYWINPLGGTEKQYNEIGFIVSKSLLMSSNNLQNKPFSICYIKSVEIYARIN